MQAKSTWLLMGLALQNEFCLASGVSVVSLIIIVLAEVLLY